MMTSFARLRPLLAASVLFATAMGARVKAEETIWSGTSAGYAIRWTTGDIEARRDGQKQTVFSARDWAKAGLAHFIAANRAGGEKTPDCGLRHGIIVLAVVGTMLSLEDHVEFTCRQEAHPGGMTRLLTLDLAASGPLAQAGRDAIGRVDPRRPGRAVLLNRLFPAADVRTALAAAPPLRDVLRRNGAEPANLPDLVDTVAEANGEGDTCYMVPPDLLAAFAFDRLEGERLVMRLGLPGDGPCRMNLTTADLSFPLPETLAPAVRRADSGQEGFFAAHGERLSAGRVTTIILRSGRGAGSP